MVYQATAPAAGARRAGLLDRPRSSTTSRREVRGNRAIGRADDHDHHPARSRRSPSCASRPRSAPLTIIGEDRADIALRAAGLVERLRRSRGASSYADGDDAQVDRGRRRAWSSASSIPSPATQRATPRRCEMPKRAARSASQPSRGKLEITDVASVEARRTRGEAAIREDRRPGGGHPSRRRR